MQLSKIIPGLKTYIAAGITILGAVIAFLTQTLEALPAIELSVNALLAVLLRAGLKAESTK